MDRFWTWLMHANARAVFYSSLVVMLAAGGWWTYRELNQPGGREDQNVSSGGKMRPIPDLPLLTYLDDQLAAGDASVPGNPFLSSDKPWTWTPRPTSDGTPRVPPTTIKITLRAPPPVEPVRPPSFDPPPRPVKVVNASRASPQTAPAETPEPVAEPVASGGPGVRTVALTYRGLFRRPDGTTMALIEDDRGGRPVFYQQGTDLFGTQLTEVKMREASLKLGDGTILSLMLGQPLSVTDRSE